MRTLVLFFIFSLAVISTQAQSLVLREAKEAPTPIAIQPFIPQPANPEGTARSTDLETMLTSDLIFSRLFKVIPADAFLETKIEGAIEVLKVDSWRQVGASYVVRGRVRLFNGETILEGFAFDVLSGKLVLNKTYKTKRKDYAVLAHQFGDDIVKIVTGREGLFSTKIAFSYVTPENWKRGRRDNKEIWVMDFNGRNAKPLVQNGRSNISPTWTKDGRSIYFTSSSVIDWHLWKTDLNGKSQQLTRFPGSALGPAMLPNGKELVISLSKDGDPDLYLLDLSGQEKKRLTKRIGLDIAPYPSNDGSKVCFSTDRWGNLHVATLDIASGEVNRLTRVGTLNDSCVWNPFDNLILFSGMDTDREFDVFAMNSKGEEMERLTYDASNNESPDFSPDGKLVVFSSKRSGRNQIYFMKADGTQVSPPIALDGDASQPTWSPRLGY